jgi:hypothetical protein
VFLFEQFQCFEVFALIDQSNIAIDADMGRAGRLAGGRAAFADAKGPGNRLGVLFVNCLALRKPFVVLVWQRDGTYLFALATAGAFGKIYKAGLLFDSRREISRLAFQIQQFGIG